MGANDGHGTAVLAAGVQDPGPRPGSALLKPQPVAAIMGDVPKISISYEWPPSDLLSTWRGRYRRDLALVRLAPDPDVANVVLSQLS